MGHTCPMAKWADRDKEVLRKVVSKATDEVIQAKELAEKAKIPPGAVRQFVSAGQLGDERCDLIAAALEELGLWPIENGQSIAVEQEIIDGIEVMQKVMEMDKPLNSRLVAVRPVLADLQRLIDEYRDSLAGKTGRSAERNP